MDTQHVILNLEGVSEEVVIEGKKYHKREAAAGAECVLNGTKDGQPAPCFYPAEVWQKSLHAWNNKPLTVMHPTGPNMAADLQVIEKQKVGFMLNARYDDKFRVTCYFDDEKLAKVDNLVYQAVLKNQVMEVSTGMKGRTRQEDGVHDGKPYKFVVEDIQPDHLAILPGQKGAYSTAMGGGLNILNADGTQLPTPITNEASYADIESAIRSALREQMEKPGYYWDGYICDVFDGYFVYRSGGNLWRQDYSVTKEGVVSFAGGPTEVVRVTMYKTIQNAAYVGIASEVGLTNQEWQAMNKDQKVAAIIQNSNGAFTDADKEFLLKKDDKALDAILGKQGAAAIQNQAPVITPATTQIPAGYVQLTPEMANILNQQVAARAAEKTKMIDAIIQNKANVLPKEWLEAQPFETVQGIHAVAAAPAVIQNAAASTGYAPGAAPILNMVGAQGFQQLTNAAPQMPKPLGFGGQKTGTDGAAK